MRILCISAILTFFCLHVDGTKPKVQNALIYLSQYGYLNPNSMGNSSLVNAKTFKDSLKDFQQFQGIPITGRLDKMTLDVMSRPRCGMKDKLDPSAKNQPFVIEGSKWGSKQLTYTISKYPKNLQPEKVDKVIQDAFNLWSKYTDLTFERSDRGKMDIRFEEGSHGDNDPFDGPGNVLAHASFPQYGGNTHFDDAEPWIIGAGEGIDLFKVAAHEFGHALGLRHSQSREALMAPTYNRDWINDLYSDDIQGIQELYGSKSGGAAPTPPVNPTAPPGTPNRPNIPIFPGFPYFPNYPRSPGFPSFPRRTPEFPSFPRRTPGFPSFPRRTPGFPSFPRITPGFPSFPVGIPNFPGVPQFPRFPQIPGFPQFPSFKRFPGFPRLSGALEFPYFTGIKQSFSDSPPVVPLEPQQFPDVPDVLPDIPAYRPQHPIFLYNRLGLP